MALPQLLFPYSSLFRRLPVLRYNSIACFVLFLVACSSSAISQQVLTYHNNNARTGTNFSESILTPSNVNSGSFGKLFTLEADGLVDAQPLYMSAVAIPGNGTHNLLIVATEHGTVYAFDADTGAKIWRIRTLKSGETTSDDRGCDQVTPEIGITSTPVISRPAGSNGVIYVVAMSKDSSGNYHQRLHALNATNGGELYNGPVEIEAKYPGTGDNSSGGFVVFDPAQYKERSGLLLLEGEVYLTWGSHCDDRPYTGWVMGYNATTLKQETVLNVTPNGNEGAIWGSGAGLMADTLGNIFFLDANGIFGSSLNASGFPDSGDYGNAFIRLTTKGGLAVADYFEMYDGQNESNNDVDLGSGGAILLSPMKDASGNTWNLAAGAGKDSNIYLVNRDSMGKFNSSKNRNYQTLSGVLPGGVWSMPAYFNNRLYYGPVGGPILAFEFKNAKLLGTPVAKTTTSFEYPGANPSISCDNGKDGIVWAAENVSPAILHAYNAFNLQELYNTNQAAGGRDEFGSGNKFITPMVANGKVYVGTTSGVGVFGLLAGK
ncbi:MAG TPA: PQQ-binding-like beta-propeller repeat protein [Candidatus Eremiobacteraceae bacterium]|nr:PQQ-binding-like beta-propeller repeat protein [Candidatus Eremiobacteraceae bacterium]